MRNTVEFITNQGVATVLFTDKRYINKIKRLHLSNPDDFGYFIENADGSVCAKIPLKWVKISPQGK